MTTPTNADKNLKEFLEKYGEEGFLKLFITNYLFELVNYFLHSKGEDKNDPSYLMHVNYKGVPYGPQEIDKFNAAIKQECSKRANLIVEELKKTGSLKKFMSEPTADPEVASLLEKAFQSIVKELR